MSAPKLAKRHIKAAITAYRAGEMVQTIAPRLNVTTHAIRYHLIRAGVWEGKKRRLKLTPAQIKKAAERYSTGEPANSVAKDFNVTLHALRYHFRKLGIWEGIRLTPIEERFWSKVDKTDGCWVWTGTKFRQGYGCFNLNGESVGAHRVSYEMIKGPIPIGLVLDHLCRNPPCVNPDHLEPVTNTINIKRGMDFLGKKYTLKS